MIRLSTGTAAALNLVDVKMDAYPTTAYLLSGTHCLMNCAFCPQGSSSRGTLKRLGRVTWPPYPWSEVEERIRFTGQTAFERICLQSVRDKDGIETLRALIIRIRKASGLPLSLSAWLQNMEEAAELFDAGVDRINISLDLVNPAAYGLIKGGLQQERLDLLLRCAERFPGRINTHIIYGFGESEAESLSMIARLLDAGITVALFAFFPLAGTKLEQKEPPLLDAYRRIQAGHYLLRLNKISYSDCIFENGHLVSYGLSQEQLENLLRDGAAFQTSGCSGCNRPYYNERPGGLIYNYHRQLTISERLEAFSDLKL